MTTTDPRHVDPDPDELARLRRIAYSRAGTDADRLRLAELDAARTDAAPETSVDETPDATVPPPPERVPATPSRPVVIAAMAGILIGVVVSGIASTLVPSAASGEAAVTAAPTQGGMAAFVPFDLADDAPSLAVFDRDPTAADDLDGGFSVEDWFDDRLTDIDVRRIGDYDSAEVFAVRGRDDGAPQVCVIVMRGYEGTSRCLPEPAFLDRGIEFSGMGLQVRWGPFGPGLWVRLS